MHVADASGTMREVTEVWVSDGSMWREAVDGWTANASGQLQQWANFGGDVLVTVTSVDHLSFRIGWEAVDATQVVLKVNGSPVYTAVTASGNYTVSGQTPSSTVSVSATATWATGSKDSLAVLHTLPVMPAPASIGVGNITASSLAVSWAPVSGATSYEVCNADTGTVLTTTTDLTWTRTGLSAGVTYRMYVKARFNPSVVSAPSVTITATTIATFPAGTYTFSATSADTKGSALSNQWLLSDSGDLRHGYYSSTRGVQTSFFFGYKDANGVSLATFFAGGAPANVIKLEVFVKRVSTSHGSSAAQLCRFYRHQHTSRPATPGVATTTGDAYQNGTLTLGESEWIALPKEWGTDLVTGAVKGLCWGGTPQGSNYSQYMIGPSLATLPSMMQVRITCA